MAQNALYAQSGGVTAVINASACGVIQMVREHPQAFNKLYAGRNGILGVLNEDLIDTSFESSEDIAALKYTPGGAFGSCRYKLKSLEQNKAEYERLIRVFKAHNIGTFFYNGGGDSQDTAHKISQMSQALGYPLICIGIPKTIDNDLPFTDNSPGFGSVAKYVAVSIQEASLDVASMASSSTKVFILEVGCQYVLVGHSERRRLFLESDALVAKKFKAAYDAGLSPVLCVGETKAEREAGDTLVVIQRQLDVVFDTVELGSFKSAIIAYEPVWAIGTGLTATPQQAEEVHAAIRAGLAAKDAQLALAIRLLYGGSVNATNASSLFSQPNIDGGLVGGASLDPQAFFDICHCVKGVL